MRRLSYLLLLFLIISCANTEPTPINLNTDGCDFCTMTIADGKFGGEIITSKGRTYKFDDIHCMIGFYKEHKDIQTQSFYIHDYNQNNVLIPAETAFYARGGAINSPMQGNTIAVKTESEAKKIALKYKAMTISWPELIK